MPIDDDLKIRLLGAIEADSLVFLCGAGLSMAPPSLLPPALTIANECYDTWNLTEPMDPLLRDNLEALADHFYLRGDFKDVFINRLIPWNSLVGSPNEGHAAIADMLICRAAKAALSANFDPLIENWAQDHKIAMRGALDGVEAVKEHQRRAEPEGEQRFSQGHLHLRCGLKNTHEVRRQGAGGARLRSRGHQRLPRGSRL